MFENSEVRTPSRGAAFWFTMIACTVTAFFVINLVRVNVPERDAATATPFVPPHSEGTIAGEMARVEAGSFHPYRANFNYRVTVKGQFRVGGSGPRVTFLILDENNYQKWKADEEYLAAVSTGHVPSGRIYRVLEAGVYYFVFDNRSGEKDAVVEVELTAD